MSEHQRKAMRLEQTHPYPAAETSEPVKKPKYMRYAMLLSAAICLILVSASLNAASIQSIHGDKRGDAYQVKAHVVMDVARQTAFAAATDFARLPAYSPGHQVRAFFGQL